MQITKANAKPKDVELKPKTQSSKPAKAEMTAGNGKSNILKIYEQNIENYKKIFQDNIDDF